MTKTRERHINDFPVVSLKDESRAIIRPIEYRDWVEVKKLYERVSPESRFFRFMIPKSCMKVSEVQYLSSVDHKTRVAFVAELQINDKSEIIGIVRYDTYPDHRDLAEFAIFIDDKYQGQGLGTFMFNHLVNFAQSKGVKTLKAFVHFGNRKMMGLIKNSGLIFNRIRDYGMWDISIYLNTMSPIQDEKNRFRILSTTKVKGYV